MDRAFHRRPSFIRNGPAKSIPTWENGRAGRTRYAGRSAIGDWGAVALCLAHMTHLNITLRIDNRQDNIQYCRRISDAVSCEPACKYVRWK